MFETKSDLTRITQGQMACFSHGCNPRKTRKPFQQLFLDNTSLEWIGITDMVEDSADDKGVLRVEAKGRIDQARKTAQQEASGNEKHEGKSDFRGCNRILQALTAAI